jgi:UDP-glucose 4-epimerase
MAKILVTGGCGYIGSHTVVDLLDRGFGLVSVDNLCNAQDGVPERIQAITGQPVVNYTVDLRDRAALASVLDAHPDVEGIIHFAALKSVGESVEQPLRYYENNVLGLVNLLALAEERGIRKFLFSSSCSVYGNTDALPVTEDSPWQVAESPYAYTKQIGERILQDVARAHPEFRVAILRYFNPAGAHESGLMGEASRYPASNLVPVIAEVAAGKRAELQVFGNDYPTRDGSCVRDYIHVMDLARAHSLAMEYLDRVELAEPAVFNLGIGEGVSVLEVVEAFERVSGMRLPVRIVPRRAGDVAAIYANHERASQKLGWNPVRTMDEIMASAWAWEQVREG